jgi:hypothetical protein
MNIPGHAGLSLGVVYGVGYLVDVIKSQSWGQRDGRPDSWYGHLWLRAQSVPVSVQRLGMDLRLVFLGAVLPDIIDKPLGFWLLPQAVNYTTRGVAHTLVFNLLLLGAALGALAAWRRAWLLTLALGSMGHLLLDQMWRAPVTLFWPFLGWRFPRGTTTLEEWLWFHIAGALRSPDELAGALVLLWFLAQLYRRRAVLHFLRTGKTG